jgi:trehalose utilization protein
VAGRIRVFIWNEFVHEREDEKIRAVYPKGIHRALARNLGTGFRYRFGTLDEPEHGLTQKALDETDVMLWWGHKAHGKVSDDAVARVHARVLDGMGLIVLHSGHLSKIFTKLMGTSGSLRWREDNGKERIWVVEPAHPIAAGLPEQFVVPHEETYGERFDVAQPDQVLFISWFEGGEVFRSGLTWTRGLGRIFYFQPGHETYPTYHQKEVIQVIRNAIDWAAYKGATQVMKGVLHAKDPLEPMRSTR